MKSGFTKNKTLLSKACGLKSRQGLYEFIAKPGFPEQTEHGFNIEECRAFVLQNCEKEAISANLDSDISDLKKWDIYERARKGKIANDLKDGKTILKSQHETEIAEMSSECQKVLYAIPSRAPEIAGLSVPEIETRLQLMIDQAVACLGKK